MGSTRDDAGGAGIGFWTVPPGLAERAGDVIQADVAGLKMSELPGSVGIAEDTGGASGGWWSLAWRRAVRQAPAL